MKGNLRDGIKRSWYVLSKEEYDKEHEKIKLDYLEGRISLDEFVERYNKLVNTYSEEHHEDRTREFI